MLLTAKNYHLYSLVLIINFQVISLGDTIKFSLSPNKSRDRLSTNVQGVPVDESNLVWWLYICWHNKCTNSCTLVILNFPNLTIVSWACRSSRHSIFTDRKLGLITFFGYRQLHNPFYLEKLLILLALKWFIFFVI